MSRCPNCDSKSVLVKVVSCYMVNSGAFYCHSTKAQDPKAETKCLNCEWEGERRELIDDD